MRYYFAPMEGLTDRIYRQTHHTFFPGLDRYYMPFFSPTEHRSLTPREERELPPADSISYCAIPQIMTKVAEDFLWAAEQCAQRGYREINLNCGCPSGTVVAKKKGAGMLADPDSLDRFLDAIFSRCVLPISIKTRLGMEDAEEFPRLLEIFNQYPIRELIIHPRVRKAFYSGAPDVEMFRHAYTHSRNSLCYNGNLFSPEDIAAFSREFPNIESVMLGRGLIGRPDMFCPTDAATLEDFFNTLLEAYTENYGGARNAMFRMKEHWGLLLPHFENSEKLGKQLRKTTDLSQFRSLTAQIFQTLPRK